MTFDDDRDDDLAGARPSADDLLERGDDKRAEAKVLMGGTTTREQSAAARLRADLQKAQPMPDGTLIRFDSLDGRGNRYTYAGVFTNGQWYLTGNGSYFPREMAHHTLTTRLASSGYRIADLVVATAFEGIEL
ncbi:MAG: hypothetical protein ABWX92_07095 [Mycetocola sp.]